mgnify:CR=1 FL=1
MAAFAATMRSMRGELRPRAVALLLVGLVAAALPARISHCRSVTGVDMDGKWISYLRVSTDRQGKSGLGIEAQRNSVAEYLNGGNWKR